MRPLRLLAVALFSLLLVAAVPAVAAKKARKDPSKVQVALRPVTGKLSARIGLSDQTADAFADPRFRALGLRLARRSVGWDMMRYDWQVADVDAWLQAARAAGVTPVITFARSRVDARRHVVPTPAQIRSAFVAFRKRWPWVTEFVASNESNHFGEPTGRRPQLAARYYKAMRSACPSCRIAAATLLDQPNIVSWTRAFVRAAGEQPRYWALHNYVSANRFQVARTVQFLRAVTGDVWITEVGGLVHRTTPDGAGKAKLAEGVTHAAQVTRFVFTTLARVSPRITRIYLYHWRSAGPAASWDSGLLAPDGRPRPAFTVLESFLRGSRTAAKLNVPGMPKVSVPGRGKGVGVPKVKLPKRR